MRPLSPDLSNAARCEILECVMSAPGIHLRSVERETHLPLGQVLYHLDRLERMGLLASSRDEGFRRYYSVRAIGREEKRFLAALRHNVPRGVLLALLARPQQNHKQLQDALGVAGSTLSFHLQRMLGADVLVRERVGSGHVYSITRPDTVRQLLLLYHGSYHDGAVEAYVGTQDDALDDALTSRS